MTTRIKKARTKSRMPARVQLTDYEADQVRQIAFWKSRPPNPVAEIFRRITLPGAKLAKKVVPDALVRTAIDQTFELAERLVGKEDATRRAGVEDLSDLHKKPLEACDRLALQTGVSSQVFATAEGAATGAGGILTTLLDIPLLFILSLRTIIKIGHCYGYPLNQRRDRHFVIGALIAALSGTLEMRRKRLDELHELEDMLIADTQEELLSEELLSILFQLEVFEGIPGIGAISGAVLNLAYMRRVDNTARRVFQERWLRDNGKVRSIAPATVHSRDLAIGWAGALRRAAYSGCYTAGFGLALPVCVLASLFGAIDNPVMQGVRDGAHDARQQADFMVGVTEGESTPRRRLPRGRRVAALA
jgi:EcsC protein family